MVLKVLLDFDGADLNKLFEVLSENGVDACFADDVLYLHVEDNKQAPLANIMKEASIANYFAQEIKKKPVVQNGNLAQSWCYQRFVMGETKKFEDEHQRELREIKERLENLGRWLQEQKSPTVSNKEDLADGRKI